uniref:Uncharacterized protein n=1 Tax=Morchella brunnea TaxID=1174671 RepID=A0A8K1I7P5_9PEZI|nr:hypothetical protein LK370_mgp088 [Morchella brunnea]UBU98396.1 hypothetical protein [Morchella brunnea]
MLELLFTTPSPPRSKWASLRGVKGCGRGATPIMSILRLPYTGHRGSPRCLSTLQFGDDGRPRLYGDLPWNPRAHETLPQLRAHGLQIADKDGDSRWVKKEGVWLLSTRPRLLHRFNLRPPSHPTTTRSLGRSWTERGGGGS